MRFLIITILICLYWPFFLTGQVNSKSLSREARLIVDNDAFSLNLYKDQYYTSGIYPAIRYVHDSSSQHKIIRTLQLNHRVYTPKKISWRYESLLDRPYAGQLSASFTSEHYFSSEKYLQVQLELGWMGPSTKVDKMQTAWHKFFDLGVPRGWQYQINDTPIINLNLGFSQSLLRTEQLELITESNIAMGTILDWMRQEMVLRFGRFLPINKSAFYSATPGIIRKKTVEPVMQEFYLFYSPGIEYVIYNASIEGNFIGKPSIYTETVVDWIIQHRFGAMMSWPGFDLGFTGYIRTKETTEATGHYYVGIRMNQRF